MAKAASSGKKVAAPRKKVSKKRVAAPVPSGPPPSLIVSISGIRGVAGRDFTPDALLPFISAFAQSLDGNRVVVGHDARPSAIWVYPFIIATLRGFGVDVIAVGLCPTPTVGLTVRKSKSAGGIVVTASHNPIEYNGLKFFSSAGEFIDAARLAKIKTQMGKPRPMSAIGTIGRLEEVADAAELHLRALISAFPPPERQRASKAPKVILDCCNSAGTVLAPDVADAYGAVFQLLNSDTSKYEFSRGAEPTPENITELCKAVTVEGADMGFAIDPDADRLAVVDELGRAIGEERTILLAADAFLSMARKKSPIVVNLSTTRAMDDLAAKHKVALHRTAIGEANVLAGMRTHRARIGGEGNGGVIVPAIQPGRDAAAAIALLLLGLQNRGGTISEWNASIPEYSMKKAKVALEGRSADVVMTRVRRHFQKAKIDSTDGIKVDLGDRWIHVRTSNTEPVIRIFAEGNSEEAVNDLIERVTRLVA